VIALDLAGHGDSAPSDGPLSGADLVNGVSTIIKAERHGPVTLIGNSLGGWIALVFALEHPEQVAQAILVNGAINRDERAGAAVTLLPATREQARRTMHALFSTETTAAPDFVLDDLVRRAPTSPLARLMAQPDSALTPYLIDARLGELRVPVTLVWGADDRLLSLAYARSAAARISGARLEILQHCGHMPQRECPGPLLNILQARLAHAGRPAARPQGD
jgi:pimeloyl-ACP methyl ester carboxylesterase